ncbi:MAG: tRNA (adenosine(37)-N6)-threonylcarbamoyltransferase complex ATPase subunit type 1 TsaE [Inhella sp.]
MAAILETPSLLHWPDEAATQAAAARLGACPELFPALLMLEGGLGAGKTTLVRHLLRALGVQGRIKSPSYAVLESYEPPAGEVHHFDFYRFSDPREWEDAGFRELLAGPGLKLVEWPEHAAGLLPQADLRLQIEGAADGSEDIRSVQAQAFTPRGRVLLKALAG